jgi:thiol peroxidase
MSVLSDYRDREFGSAFGLHIKELGLLARSVFIIGSDGRIAYRQIVGEIGREPDYGEVIEAAKKLGA